MLAAHVLAPTVKSQVLTQVDGSSCSLFVFYFKAGNLKCVEQCSHSLTPNAKLKHSGIWSGQGYDRPCTESEGSPVSMNRTVVGTQGMSGAQGILHTPDCPRLVLQ